MLLRLNTRPIPTNLIQVYAPTSDSTEAECETFYRDVEAVLKMVKKHELILVIGDFNAKVGDTPEHNIVGPFGLGTRNDRGDRLIEFCSEYALTLMNTWFGLPKRRLYTWQFPAHTKEKIVRNQIDYICVNYRYRNAITSVKTYPGADIDSDHNPLVCNVRLKPKQVQKGKPNSVLNLQAIKDEEAAKRFSQKVDEIIKVDTADSIENHWESIKSAVLKAAKEILGYKLSRKQDHWMTKDITDLFDKRREYKRNPTEYRKCSTQLQALIKEAKETELINQCNWIEHLQATHQFGELHKALRNMTVGRKPSTPCFIVDSEGKLLVSIDDRLRSWEQYIMELFHDHRPNLVEFESGDLCGPPILMDEMEYALDGMKKGKAEGVDGVPMELLMHMGSTTKACLLALFNRIYDTGVIPQDLLRSIFVTIPKKSKAVKCSDYRTISLMSHTMKVLLKIIYNRISTKCSESLCPQQFGFRAGMGTREAILAVNTLAERAIENQQEVYLCFIDYEKAFDRVQHSKLMEVLRKRGLDEKDLRVIGNLYWNQEAAVRVEGQLTDYKIITRGVRQGCILSPLLFNLYSEDILTELLSDKREGICVNGQLVNNLRYADDTVLIASSEAGLQVLLNEVSEAGEAMGLTINAGKTKSMVIAKVELPPPVITLRGTNIEGVKKFRYLGRYFTADLDHQAEIKCRIGQAKAAFFKMSKVLCDSKISFPLRYRVARCYVWSTLLYGCETWVLRKDSCNKLQAFEMWLLRKMFKIPWTSFTSNVKVLQRAKCKRELMSTIMKRKVAFFGHMQRGSQYEFLRLILEGKIPGKRSPGRPRRKWIDDIKDWTKLRFYDQLKRAAQDRIGFTMLTSKLQFEDGTP